MPQFLPRPHNMATSPQMGPPAHVPEAIQQTSSQVQMVSNIATVDATIIALGGSYVTVPGSLSATLANFDARIADLEDDII